MTDWSWVDAYNAKILERINKDLELLASSVPVPTPEDRRRMEVSDRWYRRRIGRVERVMQAYHISGHEMCDCDY